MARPARGYIHKDARGQFRYTVKAGNGRVIEAGEQGFSNIDDAVNRIVRRHPSVEEILVAYTRWRGTSSAKEVKYTVAVARDVGGSTAVVRRGSKLRHLRLEGK